MSDKIKILPDAVANQIAAGEVVNRPASVVKEMIENAVDAGARNVTVNFRDGGKALIQIIDDGCGMSQVDARLAFDRHATSKIKDVEDIYSLGTFGFRGEALASIASVAEVELLTRQHDEELGTKVEINGGRFAGQTPVNCPAGTQFLVKNLFYNVPARRRFLEKSSTESRHIITEYQRVVLCNSDIGFSLYDSDSLISKLPPSGLRQRIIGVIGKNIGKNLLEVSTETTIVTIEGFASRPASAKQTNREQFLFVNGRYFKSAYFHKAIVSAYDKLIPANTQPSYFIYLTIDPAKIDVNVHPQKTEVKFSDGPDIWQILNAAIRETLAKSGAVPPMDFDMDTSVEIPVFKDTPSFKIPDINPNPEFNPFVLYEKPENRQGPSPGSSFYDPQDHISLNSGGLSDFRPTDDGFDFRSSALEFIEDTEFFQQELPGTELSDLHGGTLLVSAGRYAVRTIPEGLIITDLRRAREAVNYERILMMLDNGSSVSQGLLFPETLSLSADDMQLIRENVTQFEALGFEMEVIGEHTVGITGKPAELESVPSEEVIFELIDSLRDEVSDAGQTRNGRLAEILSHRSAYGHSSDFTEDAAQGLLKQLAECGNRSYTPSGKPVSMIIGTEEIRKRLK